MTVFFLKTTFGKSLFVMITFTCTYLDKVNSVHYKTKRCFVGKNVKFHTGCFFTENAEH